MSPLLIQWDRIRRRWVLILVIGLVAGVGALGASLLQGTTYTGRAALTIVSQDRAPEQDTVLAQGYADYFNQASSQDVLRRSAGVPSSVTLNARIAAASPIVYIEATSSESALAGDASTKMAVALRDDVNQGLQGDSQRQIADLQRQLGAAQAANDSGQVSTLQDQIETLQSDTNQLQDLQLNAGVAANATNAARNAGAALVGALLLGALLAIALGRFENRIVTPREVSDRLGLQVLAVVGGRRRSNEDARSELLRSLMGLTNAYGMPSPGTLAVTGPDTTRASKSRVAVSLAGLRALQGQTTLLLQTDLDADRTPSELSSFPGVADFLAERGASRIDGKVFSNGRALLVGPPGSKHDDLFALFSKSNVQRLLRQGTALADLVIIDAPPVESVEGQVVCSAADRSLIVIEEGETRARDASASLEALGRIGGTALGAVLVRNAGQLTDPGFLQETTWAPVRLPAPPPHPANAPAPGNAPIGNAPGDQVPPADRTQPISKKKLDEAREALARQPGNAAGVIAGAAQGPSGGPINGRPANGTAVTPSADGPASRRGHGADPAAKEPQGAKGGPEPTETAGRTPAPGVRGAGSTKQPDPAVAPRPGPSTGKAGPTRSGSAGPSESAGSAPGPAAVNGAPAPGSKPANDAPSSTGKPANGAPAPTGKPANGAPTPTGKPANGAPTPTGKPANGASGPTPGAPTGKGPGGPVAKPSPRPKPADTPAARGSVSAAPTKAPLSPGSPAGAKRVGTARFSRGATADTARTPATSGPAETGGDGKTEDGLSAPTVTLRTDK